jgi:hypothetical protein
MLLLGTHLARLAEKPTQPFTKDTAIRNHLSLGVGSWAGR